MEPKGLLNDALRIFGGYLGNFNDLNMRQKM